MPKLYVTVGLPRSGKSTYVKKHFKDIVKISADQPRLIIHGKRFWEEKEPLAWQVYDIMSKALLEQNLDMVIDGTNVTRMRRQKIISLAQKYHYDMIALVMQTDQEVCKKRAMETGQEDLIPVIEQMAAKYEPVTKGEGFSQVIVI